MKRTICITLAVTMSLLGCATASKDIVSAPVSSLQYANYDCQQIIAESQRVQGQMVGLGGRLDQASSNDSAITTAGVILFWPALFFLGGTKAQEAQYAQLKGEYSALEKAAIEKKCIGPAGTVTAVPANPAATPPAGSTIASGAPNAAADAAGAVIPVANTVPPAGQ